MVGSRDYGRSRDQAILDAIQKFGCATAEDVADLFTGGRMQIARRRLYALHKRGLLKRFAFGRNEPFVYSAKGRSQKAHHALMVLRAYRALLKARPSGWKITAFEPEYEIHAGDKRILADGLVVLDDQLGGRRRIIFLEVNLESKFDKTANYNALYSSGAYEKAWWYREGIDVSIAVYTPHVAAVERRIREDNPYGLRWVVACDFANLFANLLSRNQSNTTGIGRNATEPNPLRTKA